MYSCLHQQAPRYLVDLLCTSVRRLSTAAFSIFYLAFFGDSAMPAQHTRSTGLLCGRPVALELSTRQLETSRPWTGQLQTSAEGAIYLHCTEAFSILETFQDETLYKLTYLLPYLLGQCISRCYQATCHTKTNLTI